MSAAFHRVVLSCAVFLALLETASGRAVLQPDDGALWPIDGLSAAQGNDSIHIGCWDVMPGGEHFDAGMEVGPNLYAYVRQNPWTAFDPDGLFTRDMHLAFQDCMRAVDEGSARLVDAVVATIGGIAAGQQQHQYQKNPWDIFGTIPEPTPRQVAERSNRQAQLNDALSALAVPEARGTKTNTMRVGEP